MVNAMETHKIKHSKQDRIFYFFCTAVLIFFLVVTLYPIIFVISASFSSGEAVGSAKVILWPVDVSLEGYEAVFQNPNIIGSYGNTILYTAVGSVINIVMALVVAYPLARKTLPGKNWLMFLFTFTMYFSGGLIPSYILMRDLKLIDSMWALILPGAVPVYNMIMARTFIQNSIPDELLEAARIDGCSDTRFFVSIVLPLSKAILAVLAIYSIVAHWNSYFSAMLYINSMEKFPLQIMLKNILVSNMVTSNMTLYEDPELLAAKENLANVLKYAMIVVSSAPIMCIYPFVQKYFEQGVMIGSLKG